MSTALCYIPPKFNTLWDNYPTPAEFTHDQLYDELGWEDLKKNPNYTNTCATRMSLCLIRSNIDQLGGRLEIKKGKYKSKWIEPGQKRLSDNLAEMFGSPEKFKLADRDKVLSNKKGIVSFMSIPGYIIDGALSGHIDLVKHGTFLYFFDTGLQCAEQCYWDSKEFWFWSLD